MNIQARAVRAQVSRLLSFVQRGSCACGCIVLLTSLTCFKSSGASFIVVNTNNAGPGSLRAAISAANTNVGLDRIEFQIPGESLQVIRLAGALPAITDSVEIDGYTQPGSSANTLTNTDNAVRKIQLLGFNRSFVGLVLRTNNSVVRGLWIRGCSVGISVEGSSNSVAGNFLGAEITPPANSFQTNGNVEAVVLGGSCCDDVEVCCNVIGGLNPEERNVMAGNSLRPIRISERGFRPVLNTRILGNFLGVDSSGTGLSSGPGSVITVRGAQGLVIGSLEPGGRNVIGAFSVHGIHLSDFTTEVSILGNYIGVGTDGLAFAPSIGSGVYIDATGDDLEPIVPIFCRIEGNRIQNCSSGVGISETTRTTSSQQLFGAKGITITRNKIYGNRNSGIWISSFPSMPPVTNDFGDQDIGANNRQNHPVVTSVTLETNTIITGVLESAPSQSYRLEFFSSTRVPASGFGEGEHYLGSTNVNTDSDGRAAFQMTFAGLDAERPYFTATATDSEGSTSMFSTPVHGRSPSSLLFHLQPKGQVVLPYTNVFLSADVTGTEPITLQWRKDGINLLHATNQTLLLSNVVWETRGAYTLWASNAFGTLESHPAQLEIIAKPTILVPPEDVAVLPGSNATFTVQAGGMLPMTYQWRHHGTNVSGATQQSLTLNNVQWIDRGNYSVVVNNSFGAVESEAAILFVKIRPAIVQQPISQTVVTGGAVTLSVVVTNTATLPLTWHWRLGNIPLEPVFTTQHVAFYTVTNITTNLSYQVIVSNIFGPPGVLSSRATLTVLADADQDGMPDVFESAHDFDSLDPEDGSLDTDLDGSSNLAEFIAGTDPRDPLNSLKVWAESAEGPATRLEFFAVSNKTYTVQFTTGLEAADWLSLTNLPAPGTNGIKSVLDSVGEAKRFYRLVTPKAP